MKRPHFDFVNFKTKFEVRQTDLNLLHNCEREILLDIDFFFSFSFNFSVLFRLFFHYRGGNEQKVRFLY